jgi:hypothetical protein
MASHEIQNDHHDHSPCALPWSDDDDDDNMESLNDDCLVDHQLEFDAPRWYDFIELQLEQEEEEQQQQQPIRSTQSVLLSPVLVTSTANILNYFHDDPWFHRSHPEHEWD